MPTDLMRAVTEILDGQSKFREAEQYYEGDQPEVFASNRLRRALSKTGTSFRLNFARTPVNSVLDRLKVTAVTAGEDDEEGTNSDQELLDSILEHNEFDEESDEVHRWSLVYGEGYVIAWPDEDEENVDIYFNTPLTTRIFYDEENPRTKSFAAKVWVEDKERTRVNLYYRDRIEKYVANKKNPKTDADFEPYVDTWSTLGVLYDEDMLTEDDDPDEPVEIWPIPNPYDKVPVYHFRTQRPHGRPEHKDAFSPQDMINKLVITQMAANDFHGFPQRYVLAGGNSSGEVSEFEDEADDEKQQQGELTSGPGELWWLEGENISVGQFSAADVKAFLDPLKEYVRAMAALTQTPIHHFEGMGNAPSGESLRAAEAPLTKKVSDRAQTFGSAWKQVFTFAMEILGREGAVVDVSWAPHESHDDKDTWEVVKAKVESGVPVGRALMETGYSESEVEEFASESSDATDPAIRVVLEMVSQAPSLASNPGLTELLRQVREAIQEPVA